MAPTSPSSTIEWNMAPPPNLLNNPLCQLEDYLQSLDDDQRILTSSLDDRQDEILNVAEFLYGHNLLTSALTLLDACATTVTKFLTANRSLYLVKGQQQQQQQPSKYLENNHSTTYLCLSSRNVEYCSCRSFLEKNVKEKNSSVGLCKHLLALKLMPHLSTVACPQITTVTDEEFANLVLDRTLGHHVSNTTLS
jgi:predicted nucleic acid-binding Zn finger protein